MIKKMKMYLFKCIKYMLKLNQDRVEFQGKVLIRSIAAVKGLKRNLQTFRKVFFFLFDSLVFINSICQLHSFLYFTAVTWIR